MRRAGMVPVAWRSSRRWRSSSRCFSKVRVSRGIEVKRRPSQKYPTSFHPVRELDLQARLGGSEPRCDCALRYPEGGADLSIRVAVVVTQNERSRLFGRDLAQSPRQLAVFVDRRRRHWRGGPPGAPYDPADL